MKRSALYGVMLLATAAVIGHLIHLNYRAAKLLDSMLPPCYSHFDSRAFLDAAIILQNYHILDRYGVLLACARHADRRSGVRRFAACDDDREKVMVLCRMLFEAPPGEIFERPMLGGASFLGGTSYRDWPLEPITLVDNIPFFIVTNYMLGGLEQPAMDYLIYCIRKMHWTAQRFAAVDARQMEAACSALINRRWPEKLAAYEEAFLRKQIRSASTRKTTTEPPRAAEPSSAGASEGR